jgi:hypothetical protein
MIEIPLSSEPEQLFSIVLGETTYDCRLTLNSRTGIWAISLSSLGVYVVRGVSLLGGIDIFGQYNIGISNAYVVNLENSSLDPDINLGISAKLFILTEEEIPNE